MAAIGQAGLLRQRHSRLARALASGLALNAMCAMPATSGAHAAAPMPHHQRPRDAQAAIASTPAVPPQVVTNCEDSGAGSLRDAIASGAPTIDLSQVTCSTITLTSGALVIPNSMVIYGPGADNLTIDGDNASPVIEQFAGAGDLTLKDVTVANGFSYGYAFIAGGITSAGFLILDNVRVTSCVHYAGVPGTVIGGGVIAEQLSLNGSVVTGNNASSAVDRAYAGGIWSWRSALIVASTISGNVAEGNPGNTGGIAADGDLMLAYSTVSDNRASYNGGVAGFGNYATTSMLIRASTISGNVAYVAGGGIGMNPASVVENSTIAFNREYVATDSAGLFVGPGANAELRSSIVADNYSGTARDDVGGGTGASLSGDHNLVMASSLATPPDTLTSDPGLMPLALNGSVGVILTHAIAASSPAHDTGANPDNLESDERGIGFARVIGSGADIGAYEVQGSGRVTAVVNCNDSGSGSLRDAIANANDGDVIDLSALTCGTITLTTGALHVAQAVLTIEGPGADVLAVDGRYESRVIDHQGERLTIAGLTLEHGINYVTSGGAAGGCIYSQLLLSIYASHIYGCEAVGPGAKGGAVSSEWLTIADSVIAGNSLATAGFAYGAGIYVYQNLTMNRCLVTSNIAPSSTSNPRSFGGGIWAHGSAYIGASTIAGNQARAGAGLFLRADTTLIDSTVSGNSAAVGAGITTYDALVMRNDTVADNVSTYGGTSPVGAGVFSFAYRLGLYSSIVFGNVSNGVADDVGSSNALVVAGANDLVGATQVVLPPDTITDDPLLGPLQDNGGPTPTHALAAGSPAIDRGSNSARLSYDQRGSGFARVIGGAADIGAFEVQTTSNDTIFANGFDG